MLLQLKGLDDLVVPSSHRAGPYVAASKTRFSQRRRTATIKAAELVRMQ